VDDTALKRLLERVADLAVVGLLTLVCCLAVVTALAAVTAAAIVLDGERTTGGNLAGRYLAAFQQSLRPTLKPQLILLAALIVGAADVAVALQWVATADGRWWVTAPVLAVGVLLLGAALVLPSYLAVVSTWRQRGSWQSRFLLAVGLACGSPGASALLAGLTVTLAVVAFTLPVLTPLLLGLYLLLCLTVVGRAVRRLDQRRRARRLTPGLVG
jgi:hypothetical protein